MEWFISWVFNAPVSDHVVTSAWLTRRRVACLGGLGDVVTVVTVVTCTCDDQESNDCIKKYNTVFILANPCATIWRYMYYVKAVLLSGYSAAVRGSSACFNIQNLDLRMNCSARTHKIHAYERAHSTHKPR